MPANVSEREASPGPENDRDVKKRDGENETHKKAKKNLWNFIRESKFCGL